jgi:Heparinase II/III-like protein/Heparinase II/III N-terminus
MRPGLVLHGLRTARPRQLSARVTRPIRRRRFGARPRRSLPAPLVANEALWRSPAFEPGSARPDPASRLASFHAGYGEDVLAAARAGANVRPAIASWIASNPPRPGDPWHPYVLSTRVGNWLAALTLQPAAVDPRIADSLWLQLEHLARNVEDEVLGNHVIRNARALVLGGAAFEDERLLKVGRALLGRELPEQVLADGGQYERSPAYHRLVLRDLLEVEPFADVGDVLPRMRAFAAATSRPDGAPALFNDGGLDLAPVLQLPEPRAGSTILADSGFAIERRDDLWLAFRCGALGPPYLPAHAHADALSFQLWRRGRPLVVDPGMPTYEAGPERNGFRGTAAHATVAVGGDQFELWGAFRSGPLPEVELDGELAAVARYRGITHRRAIELGPNHVVVHDEIDGRGRHHLTSSLPVAPGAELDVEPHGPLPLRIEDRVVAERLGERVPSRAYVVDGAMTLPVELGWTIRLP